MFLLPAYKNAGIFCYVEAFFDLAFYIGTEIAIAVEEILVLVAVAGHDVFDERFCRMQHNFVFVPVECNMGKAIVQNPVAVLQTKMLIQLLAGKHNSAVKALYQLCDFLHMGRTVGTAEKYAARTKDSCGFTADLLHVIAVEKYMICNYDIKVVICIGNCVAVKAGKGEYGVLTGIIGSTGLLRAERGNITSGIANHAVGDVGEHNMHTLIDGIYIFGPQCAVSAA